MRCAAYALELRDGSRCVVRSPAASDAAGRLAFFRKVNAQTDWLARAAQDSPADEALAAQVLEEQLDDDACLELAAFGAGGMLACASIGPVDRTSPRRRHRARVGVAVLKECWGLGLGGALVARLLAEAPAMGYTQVELETLRDNDRALRLYRRLGFREVGALPEAVRGHEGVYMARSLEAE